jgi:hypothetical protein
MRPEGSYAPKALIQFVDDCIFRVWVCLRFGVQMRRSVMRRASSGSGRGCIANCSIKMMHGFRRNRFASACSNCNRKGLDKGM